MARLRLLTDVHIDGAICSKGSIIERPGDWRGPHRPVGPHTSSPSDEPLYVQLADEHTDEATVS